MRVFVTGASGHIGSLVVPELLEAGHQVVGLARSEKAADALSAAGARVQRGSLDDLDSLKEAAEAADGVIHLAYNHDFSDQAAAAAADLRAIEAIGAALEGSGKPFVITSGTLMLTWLLPPGRLGTEEDAADASRAALPRIASEIAAGTLSERGVRSSVVRLSPTVHGPVDLHGFIPHLISIARNKGVSGYVDDGANRWPAVHELDAAHLYRLALEKAPAGSRLHGVGDGGVPFRDIAEAIGRHLNLPLASIAREEAGSHFGFLGALVSLDNPTSSELTRELLGWRPIHAGLIPDLDEGHYFDTRSA